MVSVTGSTLNNQVLLSGSGLGIGSQTIKIDMVCTLTSTTTMSGTYTLINSSSVIDTGSFNATAIAPVV